LIETKYGNFNLVKNIKDAWVLLQFESIYVPEMYDRYTYILGDISSDKLRLKGFLDDNSEQGYKRIPDYLYESINMGAPYYILKREEDK
jgi:uncharacterized protein YutD